MFSTNADQAYSLPKLMAWLTGRCIFASPIAASSQTTCVAPGIYHGSFNFDSTSDDLIDGAQLLPYPNFPQPLSTSPNNKAPELGEVPISMALTEYHFLLLYRDRVVGISNLNEELAYEDILPLVRWSARL